MKGCVSSGEQAKVMFRRSPSLSFMYGALSAVPLLPTERKTKERKKLSKTPVLMTIKKSMVTR